ncbi:unnamed protein product [Arabis nemorensis]|uniref:Pectinesterase inhibitor domain-containing protein n=1 Tax=Arabis nemorensis TaxID=586526 RepID=A0A565BZE2_9BRAS|nr:unnamed protein product [Arabis nemorensis]
MGLGVITKCFIILVVFRFASIALGDEVAIDKRCDQTVRHPSQCKNLMIQYLTLKTTTTEFLEVYVEQTLDGSVKAKSDTYSLGSQLKQGQKEAWEDCMDLYDQTIYRLNQSVSCLKKVCYGSDVQTWLSTALTNLDTCRERMSEVGVSSHSLQSVLQSITVDVINALAISKGMKRKFGILKALPIESPSTNGGRVDVVVAKDGSGDYKTIQEAVDGAGKRTKTSRRYVIRVKQGTYEEYVIVGSQSNNIMIIGDGIGKTVITGDRSNGTGFSTYESATFLAKGDGLVLKNMTIRNTAGPENKQAVALRSDSDASAFHRCSFEGFQDTLYVRASRQFFKECDIYGTVDFICGYAAVVFQDCQIFAQRPSGGVNTITAENRVNTNHTGEIVIHNSVVKGAPDVRLGGVKTYLGRPWSVYARTMVMKTQLDRLVDPKGWLQWGNRRDISSMYYAEYRNWGPGSGTENRVKWPGFHVISDVQEARRFTVRNFIDGASWLPETGVPFSVDL